MGNRSHIEGYLSELLGKPKIKLEWRDRKVLIEILHAPESVYSMTKIFNEKVEVRLPPDDGGGDNSTPKDTLSDRVFYWTSGPLSKPAVMKRIRKLAKSGLIEEIKDKKSIPTKMRFDVLQKRKKLFRATEYGLFCYLLQGRPDIRAPDELPYLLVHYWQSKVMRLLISSYFEKKTVLRPTVLEYSVLTRFFFGALNIATNGLSAIEEAEKNETWRQERIRQLEDDLLWHAKSFALRLMADAASKDKEKSEESQLKLDFLVYDKNFVKLADTAVREILSYHRFGKSLELDKARTL